MESVLGEVQTSRTWKVVDVEEEEEESKVKPF